MTDYPFDPAELLQNKRALKRERREARDESYYDEPAPIEPPIQAELPPEPVGARATTRARAIHPAAQPVTQTPAGVFAPPVRQAGIQQPIQIQKQVVQPIYRQPPAAYAPPVSEPSTADFAPMARALPKEHAPYAQPYEPPQNLEPVFDDELPAWDAGDTLVRPSGAYQKDANPARGMVDSFGRSMPEPVNYLRDMQAGFAPQLPPERIYPPYVPTGAPVHPGLGSDAFRQSFGLTPAGGIGQPAFAESQPKEVQPAFTPYADENGEDVTRKRRSNPLVQLAKKARDFVGVDDADHKLTIHDLQPTVDRRTAFHDPVYPKNMNNGGES